MIEKYWNEVFGKYKSSSGKFNIPGFPQPLMSPHFGVTNIVGKELNEAKKFWICEFTPLQSHQESTLICEPLTSVGEDFWNFQKNHNNEAYSFISQLVPFLQTLEIPHFHTYLSDESGIIASGLAGEASSGCFLFNLFVRGDKRGQGTARRMLNETRNHFSNKSCFYWTVHNGFFFDARITPYALVTI